LSDAQKKKEIYRDVRFFHGVLHLLVFQESLHQLIPVCRAVLVFTAARHDAVGSHDQLNT